MKGRYKELKEAEVISNGVLLWSRMHLAHSLLPFDQTQEEQMEYSKVKETARKKSLQQLGRKDQAEGGFGAEVD